MEKGKNEIVVYQPNETVRLGVQLARYTVWLTIMQMCQLFGRERTVITTHLNNAIKEGELDAKINVQNVHFNQRGRRYAGLRLYAPVHDECRSKTPPPLC